MLFRAHTTAVLLPGSGSDADFVLRAFAPLTELCARTVAVDAAPPSVVAGYRAALDAAASDGPMLACGVSLGSAVAASWALENPGADVTLVSYSIGVGIALDAAMQLAADGIEAEVIDLRTLLRFLPYLWPKDSSVLRARLIAALVLVFVAKGVNLIMPFAYKGAIDAMAARTSEAAALAMSLVVAYAAARLGGVLFDNLRNALFERVSQTGTRKLALQVFRHLHALSLRYHLERRTGELTRVMERATRSVDEMLYFLFFNIAPTLIEIIAVCAIFWINFGIDLVLATIVMVAAYIGFTWRVTEWRNRIRREAIEHDNKTATRAVDSLLNYETVKYFSAEEYEARRYEKTYTRFSEANIKNEVSLAWLNIGQSLITNLMMGGAMAYTVWGWSRGQFSTGDVVLVNTLLSQLFRPLDLLGMVYRTIRQGLIDMAEMFRLIDTPEFPEEWKTFARGGIVFLDALRGEKDIDWTFFSPAALIEETPRLGRYRTGTDQLVVDANGDSKIGFSDYAIAMVDELENPKHSRARFTAAY